MSQSAPPVELSTSHSTQLQPTQLAITFWGVRAHLPTPGLGTAQYGGNTACLEICADGYRLIFDGGTGLKALGDALIAQFQSKASAPSPTLPEPEIAAHLFFTHARWDRIQGFPFFSPAFKSQNQLDIYGAAAANGASIKQCLSTQMLQPNCPIAFYDLKAKLRFHHILGGQSLKLGALQIATLTTNPYTGGVGYRIRYQGRTVVYATAACYATMGPVLAQWSREADLLICNAGGSLSLIDNPPFDNPPSPPTWQAATELATTAQAKQTLLTGFSPDQTDQQLNEIAQLLQKTAPTVRLAQERMQICL